jgi:hypothetical protein
MANIAPSICRVRRQASGSSGSSGPSARVGRLAGSTLLRKGFREAVSASFPPRETAVSPAAAMFCWTAGSTTLSGQATTTSWPALCNAQASGTTGYRWAVAGKMQNMTRIADLPDRRAGPACGERTVPILGAGS